MQNIIFNIYHLPRSTRGKRKTKIMCLKRRIDDDKMSIIRTKKTSYNYWKCIRIRALWFYMKNITSKTRIKILSYSFGVLESNVKNIIQCIMGSRWMMHFSIKKKKIFDSYEYVVVYNNYYMHMYSVLVMTRALCSKYQVFKNI